MRKRKGFQKPCETLKNIDVANLRIPYSMSNAIEKLADKKDIIVILGLSYKPNTPLTVESQSVMLARILAKKGFRILLHDPMASNDSIEELTNYSNAKHVKSLEECIQAGTFFVLATPWDDYKNLLPKDFTKNGGSRITILDCWRVMKKNFKPYNKKIRYIQWGIPDETK